MGATHSGSSKRFIHSTLTNRTMLSGTCRAVVGTSPLYTANTPSRLTVFAMQSNVPEYGILPCSSAFMLIKRDLARSIGFDVSAGDDAGAKRRPGLRQQSIV